MHFLITAGPTREYIDPVRFLSNGSTGKMGYACATAAVRRGHKVTLVSGLVNLAKPKGVDLIKVTTSDEMAKAVRKIFNQCDCVIMTAAVSDYKPLKREKYKIQKIYHTMSLTLRRTIDILAELGNDKVHQLLIGFAVQDRSPKQNAIRKMSQKNLDVVVLNSPASFGADHIDAQVLQRGGSWEEFPNTSKNTLATTIVRLTERQYKEAAVKTDNT